VLDVAEEQPEGAIFLIPIRLEECDVPEKLQPLHWVNYKDEGSYERLIRALNSRFQSLGTKYSSSVDAASQTELVTRPLIPAAQASRPYAFERFGGALVAACFHEDGQHVWAGGENGRILRSEDGGKTWERVVLGRGHPIVLAIRFPGDVDRGWALALDGASSAIYKTSNGGRDWTRAASFHHIIAGDFVMHRNGQNGWAFAVEGGLIATTNGWQSWNRIEMPPFAEFLRQSSWPHGLAVGDHGRFVGISPRRTGFDLDNWLSIYGRLSRRVATLGERAVSLSAGSPGQRFSIGIWNGEARDSPPLPVDVIKEAGSWSCPSFDVALGPSYEHIHILLTHGALLQSTDGVATWRLQRPAGERSLNALAVQPCGSKGILAGDNELILLSTDNGVTWSPVHDPLDGEVGDLFSVAMDSSGRTVCIVGAGRRLLRSENFGRTWRQSQFEEEVTKVVFTGGNTGWAWPCCVPLLRTRDGGRNWMPVKLGTDSRGASISEVCFDPSGKRGWVTARHGGQFFFTEDSGETWQEGRARTYPESREDFPGIAWQPVWDRVWFVGYDLGHDDSLISRACRSVYPYSEFEPMIIPIAAPVFRLWFSPSGKIGFALSNTGVARSTDGGETWEACPLSEEFAMAHGFWFDREGRTGLVYGLLKNPSDNNDLLRTADGGQTWFAARFDKRNLTEYSDLAFSDDCSYGWLVGANGFVYSASLPDSPPVIHQFAVSRKTGALELRVETPGVEPEEVVVDIAVSGPGLDFVQDKVRRRFRFPDLPKVPKWSPAMFLPGQSYHFQLQVSNGWNIASQELVLRPC